MPYYEKEIQRIYWDIHEVAADLCVETSCIRFWLDYFKIDYMVKRTEKHVRKFTAKNIALLTEIHRLVKVEEYKLMGAKKRLIRLGMIPDHKSATSGRPTTYRQEMNNMMRVI